MTITAFNIYISLDTNAFVITVVHTFQEDCNIIILIILQLGIQEDLLLQSPTHYLRTVIKLSHCLINLFTALNNYVLSLQVQSLKWGR
jgi:hypothetical protein